VGKIVERDFGRDGCRTARLLRRIEALPTLILKALWKRSDRTEMPWGYSRDEIRVELIRRGEGLHCMT
jgi:hypothetical protein